MGIEQGAKIAIFVSFSGKGGMERMMVNLCEGLNGSDTRVTAWIPLSATLPKGNYPVIFG